jgi:hypothetical protein
VAAIADPSGEARRILRTAEERKVVLRLLGGVSFLLRCPSAADARLKRDYRDLDFMARSKQSKEIGALFKELGYVPREMFNAWQGRRRLIFNDLVNQRRADVFLDVFEMSHKLDFRDRLEVDKGTLPLADMLATKLQIHEINEKDLKDMVCMLADYDVGETDSGMVNGKYIAGLCAGDWGIYKTFTANLAAVAGSAEKSGLDGPRIALLKERTEKLMALIEGAPKSMKWKLRAGVGEKVKWYEVPEADIQVVDSRISKDGGQEPSGQAPNGER